MFKRLFNRRKSYYLFKKQGTNSLKDQKKITFSFYKFCIINRKNGRVRGAHAMHVHRLFPLFN